jgi:hypothetical protein
MRRVSDSQTFAVFDVSLLLTYLPISDQLGFGQVCGRWINSGQLHKYSVVVAVDRVIG